MAWQLIVIRPRRGVPAPEEAIASMVRKAGPDRQPHFYPGKSAIGDMESPA